MKRSDRSKRPGKGRMQAAAHQAITRAGYQPLRLCWPDYLVIRKGKAPVTVTIRRHLAESFDVPDLMALRALMQTGVECWCWTYGVGFQEFAIDDFNQVYLDTVISQPARGKGESGKGGQGG